MQNYTKYLVSMIVPIYNVELYLKRCIDSILVQTYEKIEIILVDDGSDDSCPQICDDYAVLDDRIRVIHKINGGLSDARNAGVERSKGDYICFVDSDDMIADAYVENLLKICIDYECDISICSFLEFSQEVPCRKYHDNVLRFFEKSDILENLYNEDFLVTVVAWNKMYRREIVEKYQYPKGLLHEDESTTAKYLYEAKRVGMTSEILYFYYLRPGSITQSVLSSKRMDDKLTAIRERIKFYQEKSLKRYVSLDELRLLKTISKNSCLAYEREMKDYYSKMKTEYRTLYNYADHSYWSLIDRALMLISFVWTPFRGWIGQIKVRKYIL